MSKMITYTRKRPDPCDIAPDDIDIRDIAHALSLICRAGGQFPTFYSVGQHCIACAREAEARGYSKRLQLACLLHDASEAYIADIIRPVKSQLPDYYLFEKNIQDKIYKKFLKCLPSDEEQKLITDVDDGMLCYEFTAIMNHKVREESPEILTKPDIRFYGFEKTEKEFLKLFEKLIKGI